MKTKLTAMLMTISLLSGCNATTTPTPIQTTTSTQETTPVWTTTSIEEQIEPIVTEHIETTTSSQNGNPVEPAGITMPTDSGLLTVHFIDVGQGDSEFIELPNGETMLIDAGEFEYGDKVVTYIYEQGYDTIDYVIATHLHSDHIGGMPNVIDNFNVKNFYTTSDMTITNTYEKLLDSVENSKALTHETYAGDVILETDNLLIETVAPKVLDDDERNNNSIVIKLTYGDTKFLFTGDAEKQEEDDIWTNIKCDVLKIGHHGSDSSTSNNFLKKVEPKYAVISCGLYNEYGHPTQKTLDRLETHNIQVYRTDMQGTIMFTSDGSNIAVDKSPVPYERPAETKPPVETTVNQPIEQPANKTTYVLNTNSKIIHLESCSSVDKMSPKNKAETDDYDAAIEQGYRPCKICLD